MLGQGCAKVDEVPVVRRRSSGLVNVSPTESGTPVSRLRGRRRCFDGDAECIWGRLAEQYGIRETKDVSMEFMAPRTL